MNNVPNRNKNVLACCLIFLVFVTSVIFGAHDAHAIRVSMKRVIFDSKKRSEILTIINNTPVEQTYRIGWRKYRMDPNKALRYIQEGEPDDDILWADKMVRFAPRRVNIPAGGSQQIRLLFRRPKELAEAEYRAHLWIVTETKPEQFSIKQPDAGQGQSVRLAVQPAISLPVFVRNGDLEAKVEIQDLVMSKEGSSMQVKMGLAREGLRSVYGDLDFICTTGGKELILHQVRGISVYTEISRRNMKFEISLDTPEEQGCSDLTVTYRADVDDPQYRGGMLAEASTRL